MKLPLIIESWKKGSWFLARAPELDFISQGRTLEEARGNLLEVISIQCEEMKDKGEFMLTEYVQKAMGIAHYEIIEEEGTYWGEIPNFQGVWSRAKNLEKCREELREALEEWITFRLKNNLEIPVIEGINLF